MRNFLSIGTVSLLLMLNLPTFAVSAGSALVQYDRKKDTITVEAAGTDIEDVLSEIAYRTGMRILIDPEVQKNVTINLKEVPLESALHQIARGLSYALFYESGMRKQRVVGMRLVPKGQPGSAPLKELGRSAYQQPAEALSYTGGGVTGGRSDNGAVMNKNRRSVPRQEAYRVGDYPNSAGDLPTDADSTGKEFSTEEGSVSSREAKDRKSAHSNAGPDDNNLGEADSGISDDTGDAGNNVDVPATNRQEIKTSPSDPADTASP